MPKFNFADKYTTTSQGVPYDYASIMHFTKKQFSSNGNPTLVPKATKQTRLGGANCPTFLDYFHVILLYCEGKENQIHAVISFSKYIQIFDVPEPLHVCARVHTHTRTYTHAHTRT